MIKNKTTKKIIIKNHKLANTFIKRGIGLMFKFKEINYGLIFDLSYESKERATLHMFFVFFKINVLFLNENKEVVDIKRKFRPFCIYTPKKKSRYVIELPLKTNLNFVNIGNKVEWD